MPTTQPRQDRQIAFETAEYARRLTEIQSRMRDRGLDGLVTTTTENIYYVTGYQTFGGADQALVITLDRNPVLVLRGFESHLVGYTTWLNPSRDVRTWLDSDDPQQALIDTVSDLGLHGKKLGLELGGDHLRVTLYRRLNDEADIGDCTGLIESVRVIKSEPELALMRRAGHYTCAGLDAAFRAVAKGNTDNDVAAAAFDAMVRAGSEYLANDPIVTAGHRSGIPHTTFCRYNLQQGDTVLIELGANHHRYFAPLMRTAVVGPASDKVRSMYEACVDALEAALSVIRPGITAGEAHDACQRVIDSRGYAENFKKRLGYGVGIGWRSWSEGHIISLREGDETELAPGMTFHMPPALRDVPVLGVGCSESIVVTSNGCECLIDYPRDLVEA